MEFDGGDAEEESDNADPRGVKPMVEGGTEEPSRNRGGGEHEGQLAVAADLDPWIFLGVG